MGDASLMSGRSTVQPLTMAVVAVRYIFFLKFTVRFEGGRAAWR